MEKVIEFKTLKANSLGVADTPKDVIDLALLTKERVAITDQASSSLDLSGFITWLSKIVIKSTERKKNGYDPNPIIDEHLLNEMISKVDSGEDYLGSFGPSFDPFIYGSFVVSKDDQVLAISLSADSPIGEKIEVADVCFTNDGKIGYIFWYVSNFIGQSSFFEKLMKEMSIDSKKLEYFISTPNPNFYISESTGDLFSIENRKYICENQENIGSILLDYYLNKCKNQHLLYYKYEPEMIEVFLYSFYNTDFDGEKLAISIVSKVGKPQVKIIPFIRSRSYWNDEMQEDYFWEQFLGNPKTQKGTISNNLSNLLKNYSNNPNALLTNTLQQIIDSVTKTNSINEFDYLISQVSLDDLPSSFFRYAIRKVESNGKMYLYASPNNVKKDHWKYVNYLGGTSIFGGSGASKYTRSLFSVTKLIDEKTIKPVDLGNVVKDQSPIFDYASRTNLLVSHPHLAYFSVTKKNAKYAGGVKTVKVHLTQIDWEKTRKVFPKLTVSDIISGKFYYKVAKRTGKSVYFLDEDNMD